MFSLEAILSSFFLTFTQILLVTKIGEFLVEIERFSAVVGRLITVYLSVAAIIRFAAEGAYLMNILQLSAFNVLSLSALTLVVVSLTLTVMLLHMPRVMGSRTIVYLGIFPILIFAVPLLFGFATFGTIFFYSPYIHLPLEYFAFNMLMATFYGISAKMFYDRRLKVWPILSALSAASLVMGAVLLWLSTRLIFDALPSIEFVSNLAVFYGVHGMLAVAAYAAYAEVREQTFAPKKGLVNTGISILDKLLPNGLPYPAAIAVMGPAGSGRTTILSRLVITRLEQWDGVLFFSVDQPAAMLLSKHGSRSDVYHAALEEGRLIMLSVDETGKLKLNPQDLQISLIENISKLNGTRLWVVIDSFTTLFQEFGNDTAMKVLRTFVQKSQQTKFGLLFSYNPLAFPRSVTAMIEDCVNGVIEIAAEEKNKKIHRKIRVKWMIGYKPSGEWVPIEEIV